MKDMCQGWVVVGGLEAKFGRRTVPCYELSTRQRGLYTPPQRLGWSNALVISGEAMIGCRADG